MYKYLYNSSLKFCGSTDFLVVVCRATHLDMSVNWRSVEKLSGGSEEYGNTGAEDYRFQRRGRAAAIKPGGEPDGGA